MAPPASPPLYLPISTEAAARLASGDAKAVVDTLSTPELAAALVLMKLPQTRLSATDGIEKLLASAITAANETAGTGINPLRDVLARDLDAKLLEIMLLQLDVLSLVLMDEAEVEARQYLDAQGNWDFRYRFRRNGANPLIHDPIRAYPKPIKLTDPQVRITECLLLNRDEPLHVQGYAGTGKTHLLASIVSLLSEPNKPLVLCQTQQQIRAIQERIPATNARFLTFQMLALEALDQLERLEPYAYDYWRPSTYRMSGNSQVSDAQLAQHLGLQPVGVLTAPSVANLCRRMIMSFCAGPAASITPVNIPRGFTFSAVEQAVLVEYAVALWQQILLPTTGLEVPIRAYHLIKLMALKGYGIPEEYTHVVVDESHDLSVPMLQVLERSKQAFITLGDDLQALSGHVKRHSSHVRTREIGQAVRAGKAMESVLSPLIEAHPLSLAEVYQGNRSVGTVITHYDSLKLPANPTTILVKDLWGMLEWFLRLSQEEGACGFELLGNRHQFSIFALDLIGLFNDGRRPRHGLLFRYASWEKLYAAETASGNKSLERVARRLEKGLTKESFEQLLLRIGTDRSSGYRLGLVNEVRNMEFDSVMLAPDLLPQPRPMSDIDRGKLLSLIYTGASRARQEIIVPGYLADWVADLKRLAAK